MPSYGVDNVCQIGTWFSNTINSEYRYSLPLFKVAATASIGLSNSDTDVQVEPPKLLAFTWYLISPSIPLPYLSLVVAGIVLSVSAPRTYDLWCGSRIGHRLKVQLERMPEGAGAPEPPGSGPRDARFLYPKISMPAIDIGRYLGRDIEIPRYLAGGIYLCSVASILAFDTHYSVARQYHARSHTP